MQPPDDGPADAAPDDAAPGDAHSGDADLGESGSEEFDPRQAAELLELTTRRAQREFNPHPLAVMVAMALLVLGAYVVLWQTSTGQHPYSGPSIGAVGILYGVVALTAIVATQIYRRATAGVSGPSVRQQKIEGVALGLSFCGSPSIQGALYHYHASHAIVYGVIPAAGPLIIIGTTLVGIAGAKDDWPQFAAAIIAVLAGLAALFVGPSTAWLVAGLGLSGAMIEYAVARAISHSNKDVTWMTTPSTQ